MRGFGLLLSAVVFLSGCQPSSTASVLAPSVELECGGGVCSGQSGEKYFIVFATRAGCANPEFSAEYSSSGYASCSGGTCRATAGSWISSSGTIVPRFPADTYDFCGLILFNGSLGEGTQAGDAIGTLESISLLTDDDAAAPLEMTSWSAY